MKNPDPYKIAKMMLWELAVLRVTTEDIRTSMLTDIATAAGVSVKKLDERLKDAREKAILDYYNEALEEAGFEPEPPGNN